MDIDHKILKFSLESCVHAINKGHKTVVSNPKFVKDLIDFHGEATKQIEALRAELQKAQSSVSAANQLTFNLVHDDVELPKASHDAFCAFQDSLVAPVPAMPMQDDLAQSIFDKSDRKAVDRWKHCPKCDHKCDEAMPIPKQETAGAVPEVAITIVNSIIEQLNSGFIVCGSCGNQEETKDMDIVHDLNELREVLITSLPSPRITEQPDSAASNEILSLAMDQLWSMYRCVQKLLDAANILLYERGYDGHGHELIREAKVCAEKYIHEFRPFSANNARSITEQDARDKEVIANVISMWDDIYPDMESGKYPQERLEDAEFNEMAKLRALLNKLNANAVAEVRQEPDCVPSEWPTASMIVRGCESLHDEIKQNYGIDLSDSPEASRVEESIVESIFDAMLSVSPQFSVPSQAAAIPDQWRLNGYGQVKAGDLISMVMAGRRICTSAKEVLNAGTNKEEIVYNRKKNHYFITSMVLDGTSSHKDVFIIPDHSLSAAPKPDETLNNLRAAGLAEGE